MRVKQRCLQVIVARIVKILTRSAGMSRVLDMLETAILQSSKPNKSSDDSQNNDDSAQDDSAQDNST